MRPVAAFDGNGSRYATAASGSLQKSLRLLLSVAMLLVFLVPVDASAGCAAPIIGLDSAGVEPFPQVTHNRIDIQYHDQCSGEEYTRVYGRTGLSGSFQLIRSEPANMGGWRTKAWTGRQPDTIYCFYVKVKGADGTVRKSGVRCATTAPSDSSNCATPRISAAFPGWRSVAVVSEDRCSASLQTKIRVYDWPNGASSGTFLKSVSLTPVHLNGERTVLVDGLEPTRRYCFQVSVRLSLFGHALSNEKCTMPTGSPFGGSGVKARKTTGVGILETGTSAVQGIAFTPWESRVWSFKNRQVEDNQCRSVLVRDQQGNFVGKDSGCFGLEVPLNEGETYYVYLVNGVSTAQSPATCRLYVDDVLTATEKCGWTMTPLSGLNAGDRIQAVHLPPSDLLPPQSVYPASKPPRVAMVVIPDEGVTSLLSGRGNFIANGAEVAVPEGVSAAMVLTGFSPNSGAQAGTALSQPLRLLVNDVDRSDSDGDGLGDQLEVWLGTCANPSGSTGAVSCADVYDHRDSDGDGISDGWEVLGRRKSSGLSGEDLPLPYWGANPMHKDIFAEMDYAHKNFPNVDFPKFATAESLRLAAHIWSFGYSSDPVRRNANAADLQNPDGQPGIAIHFDAGMAAQNAQDWAVYGDWGGWDAVEATAIPVDTDGDGEDDSFVFDNEDKSTLWDTMDGVRYGVFRHITTFGWDAGGGQAGWGLSQDVGIANNDGTPYPDWQIAELITHEMGHTLGFGHASPHEVSRAIRPGYDAEPGGGRNCKPLYYSAMNYSYQGQNPVPVHGFADGFSYNQRSMRPRALLEVGALDYYVPNSTPETRELFLQALADKYRYKVDPVHGSVDWNRNGVFDAELVAAGLSTRPFGDCEQGRVNRTNLNLGFGWEDDQLPSSLSSVRDGNLTHLLYTDSENRVRWLAVSFSEDCPTADEDSCVGRYPSMPTPDPVVADPSRGADIALLRDGQGNKFLLAAFVREDGTLEVRTRDSLQQPGGGGGAWSSPNPVAWNTTGIPEIIATPGNGSGHLGAIFYKDDDNILYMRRISGTIGAIEFGDTQLVLARNEEGFDPQPVILGDADMPAALYSYPHNVRPAENQASGASKAIHLFLPQGDWVRVLNLPLDSPSATFFYLDEIFTGGIANGSKLAPLWVNAQAGEDSSGRLYLYYGQRGGVHLARAYERGTREDGDYHSEWVAEPFGKIDPGAPSGTVFTAAIDSSDAEPKLFTAMPGKRDSLGAGGLQVRPRPENIEHFEYQGYNDWLTFRYTLCKQTAEGMGKVPQSSGRINCRPLPSHEPSPRL